MTFKANPFKQEIETMESLHIRISGTDKHDIETRAKAAHLSVSEFVRTLIEKSTSEGTIGYQAELAAALCNHDKIVNRIEEGTVRQELVKWEKSLWQTIK